MPPQLALCFTRHYGCLSTNTLLSVKSAVKRNFFMYAVGFSGRVRIAAIRFPNSGRIVSVIVCLAAAESWLRTERVEIQERQQSAFSSGNRHSADSKQNPPVI